MAQGRERGDFTPKTAQLFTELLRTNYLAKQEELLKGRN
jgi:hypothetical protein